MASLYNRNYQQAMEHCHNLNKIAHLKKKYKNLNKLNLLSYLN